MCSLFCFAQESHACNISPTSMASTWDNRGVGPRELGTGALGENDSNDSIESRKNPWISRILESLESL